MSTKTAAARALEFVKKRIPSSFRDEDEMIRVTLSGRSSTYDAWLDGHAEGLREAMEPFIKIVNGESCDCYFQCDDRCVHKRLRELITKFKAELKR